MAETWAYDARGNRVRVQEHLIALTPKALFKTDPTKPKPAAKKKTSAKRKKAAPAKTVTPAQPEKKESDSYAEDAS